MTPAPNNKLVHASVNFYFACILLAMLLQPSSLFAQVGGRTVIKGTVTDSLSSETLPYVTIMWGNHKTGVISDNNGKFSAVVPPGITSITISYVGYLNQDIAIKPGRVNQLDIRLSEDVQALKEVIVKPGKARYKNRNNPAVDLIENVIRNRSLNKGENLHTLQYDKYEKDVFALSNISDDFKKKRIFDKFQFVFDNTDTTKIDSKQILPVYIRELLSDCYFKQPNNHKEITRANKMVSLDGYVDNKGVSEYLKYFYQDINIYNDNILFVSNQFLSPIAGTAPVFYKYFILDTSMTNNTRIIHLAFVPRNKTDMLF